jgi:hypothetical protein
VTTVGEVFEVRLPELEYELIDRVIDAVKALDAREYQRSCRRKFCKAVGQSKSQYAVPVEADRANLTAVEEKPSKGNSAAVVVVVTVTPPVPVQMLAEEGAVIKLTPPELEPMVCVMRLDKLVTIISP